MKSIHARKKDELHEDKNDCRNLKNRLISKNVEAIEYDTEST